MGVKGMRGESGTAATELIQPQIGDDTGTEILYLDLLRQCNVFFFVCLTRWEKSSKTANSVYSKYCKIMN